jgi:predicted MFS family arabinose efflux permease
VQTSTATRAQFFLSYAVLGSVIPFLSVWLAERGLGREEIGSVWAVSSLAVVLTPLLVTLLADTAVAPRVLMAIAFAVAGAALLGLAGSYGYAVILAVYGLHALALQPVFPLQDGIFFADHAARGEPGARAESAYPAVRVWGTIGYIVAGWALYFVLRPGSGMTPVLVCGAGFGALGAINALRLPRTPRPSREERHARLPTVEAARVIGERHVLVFCVAMFLLHLGAQAFYQFYPLHLTQRAGIDGRWVGVISSVGVVVEIFFMLGFARLVRAWTLRRVMYWGAIATGARLLLLAGFAGPVVAIGVQLLHGMTVLVLQVAPPVFLNSRADDRYRNSIQGLYTMAFAGAGRVVGALVAGWAAQRHGIGPTFAAAGVACALATLLFYFAFHDVRAAD